MKWTIPGLPESAKEKASSLGSGSLGDVVWKLIVVALLTVASLLLLSAGPYGAAVGGILLGTLLSDDVRKMVSDVWNRNWAEVTIPF